jgi:GNAT superfamily N-acetyltransferase
MLLDSAWVPQALLLSQEAGWNQVAEDWKIFFTYGRVLGFVAGGRLVATSAVLPYGPALGWVSMVLVTAEWRRRGLGTRLVADCTAALRDSGRAALLDAVPAAASIYAGLGFAPLCPMERWEGLGSELEQFRNYCGVKKIARCGFPWEKTTRRPVASVYPNC